MSVYNHVQERFIPGHWLVQLTNKYYIHVHLTLFFLASITNCLTEKRHMLSLSIFPDEICSFFLTISQIVELLKNRPRGEILKEWKLFLSLFMWCSSG